MGLFGSARDISMFRHVNRELINEIIDTQCDIYKHSIFDSKENLYGEALRKVFLPGVRTSGLIEKSSKEWTSEEYGADYNRQCKFSFLRDDLASLELGEDILGEPSWGTTNPNENAQNADIFLEVGDVIHWDGKYWEVDTVSQGQYLFGKNPDHDHDGGTHGASWSVIVETHEMRRSKINTLENVKAGYDEYVSGTKVDEQRGGLYG
jgi:hypothetical protein